MVLKQEICIHSKCRLNAFGKQNKCIFHCEKNNWNENDDELFWKEIRKLHQFEEDFYMFQDIVFPSPLHHFYKEEFFNKDYILEYDYLFWKKGEKKSFGNLAQFTNCVFDEFAFRFFEAQTINLTNCTIKNNLDFSFMYVENLSISKSKNINRLEISNHLKTLDIDDCSIKELGLKNVKVDSIKLQSLDIETITFNDLTLKNGVFQNLNIKIVKDNAMIFLEDSKRFFYKNVIVKIADREYFRFLKKIFSEKEDFINVNEMYTLEMNSYYKELYEKLNGCKNFSTNLQNFLIVFFAKYASNFGKSWIRPLGLLILTSIFNVWCTNDYSINYLFSNIDELWKQVFKSIYFFDKETLTPLRTIFNIFQGLFIYQLIVAIKRKIKFS
ncbi:hypothetical protein [Aliarcobacter butzleri]|uniref:hypothetical protein n=1 Tax=Aliarcobacter butzleri TaxID=28197 RepID=UPI00125EC2BF|nr:hypothetical protein [Aliarcobacter butzleri]